MTTLSYGRTRQLAGLKFDQALELVVITLRHVGLAVVTKFDIAEMFKRELGLTRGRYVVLGVSNVNLTHRAVREDCQAGLVLPCRVVVREESQGSIVVSVEDPRAVFALVGSESLDVLANEFAGLLGEFLDLLA